jgi:hypothetical protein
MKFAFLPIAAAAVLSFPAAASASLHDCDLEATKTATISSSRDMSCETAAKEMQRYRGEISRTFKTPGGYACSRVSGGQFGGQWRCVKGHKAFRFEFAD